MAYAKIHSKDPEVPAYQLTERDVLWAGRAAQFEGGDDPADTLWTWTQRFMLPTRRRLHGTLADMIKAHSQPVNPIWRRDGAKCAPGAPYHGTERCSANRLARRDYAAAFPLAQLDPEVKARLYQWANGQLPNPVPRAVDFADPSVTQGFLRRNPDARLLKQAGNWFVTTAESQRWAADHITMTPGSSWRTWAVVLGLATATGGLVYWLRR